MNVSNSFIRQLRESGRSLKCIRTDNGGEYIGQFDSYCKVNGIRHEMSVPKTPQLNGVAERMNRTLIEKVRSMLSHACLSRRFWGEAMLSAVQVINLSPSSALNGETPEKVWSGRNKSYKHLKVIGCKAFVHIPSDERFKLDPKSKACIYLSSGEDKFGYKLFDPVNKKVLRSRDVVFMEDKTIKDIDSTIEEDLNTELVDMESDDDSESDSEIAVQIRDGNTAVETNHSSNDPETDEDDSENNNQEGTHQNSATTQNVATRSSTRVRMPSSRYSVRDYVLLTDEGEPVCYQEAVEREDKTEWLSAMQEEMNSLLKNQTYTLVQPVEGKKVLRNRWIFKLKTEEGKVKPRYKARLVVKGFAQTHGVDYGEIFSPVVKMTSIRFILAIAASEDLEIE